jgi:CheY-like chemotaxis protein
LNWEEYGLEQKGLVLLVDDDSALLESVKQGLDLTSKYSFDLAFSAEGALEKMEQTDYVAIVCDIQMPVMDGFEFLRSLRANGNEIPFIVFTVTDDKATALRAFRFGANGFVGKYGKPEVVLSTLVKCIDDAVSNQSK